LALLGSLYQYLEESLRRRSGFGISTLIPISSHFRLITEIHVGVRRERYSFRAPKQPFLSLFTYFSPSGIRSAIQLSPIELFLEPDLCQIQPNGAHFAVFRKDIAPFLANLALFVCRDSSWKMSLRRRSEFGGVQVSQNPSPECSVPKKRFFVFANPILIH